MCIAVPLGEAGQGVVSKPVRVTSSGWHSGTGSSLWRMTSSCQVAAPAGVENCHTMLTPPPSPAVKPRRATAWTPFASSTSSERGAILRALAGAAGSRAPAPRRRPRPP